MSFIKDLFKTKKNAQTVFTTSDLSTLISNYSGEKLKSAIKNALQKKDLIRISKGIYSIKNDYSKQEFANKYKSPSYISLYTVLQESGVIFQPYESIYLISNRSQEVVVDSQKYIYRKIKDEILLNPFGIINVDNINRASPERAICDKIYLDGLEYFDNLTKINWGKIIEINKLVFSNNQLINKWILKNTKQI